MSAQLAGILTGIVSGFIALAIAYAFMTIFRKRKSFAGDGTFRIPKDGFYTISGMIETKAGTLKPILIQQKLVVGAYDIGEFSKTSYWIQGPAGDGTEVSKERFEKLIADFFREVM